MTFGTVLYGACLTEKEPRTLLRIAVIAMIGACLFDIAFTLKAYEALGISPFVFIFFTSSTLFPLILAFFIIPLFVIVAKISPTHVEATIFSFSASVSTGCLMFISKMVGVLWNKLTFQVSADSLDDLYKLYIIEIVGLLICLFYAKLIPTWAEVEEVQNHLKDLHLSAKTPLKINKQGSIESYDGENNTPLINK